MHRLLYRIPLQTFYIFTLDAGLLAVSQYPEGPATGHLDTGFSWFPCVYKQMLRWFPKFQVATTCFSCSPPDLTLWRRNYFFSEKRVRRKYGGKTASVLEVTTGMRR